MSKMVAEPPSFVSDEKTYAAYKADLQLWSHITSVEKGKQAETVTYMLEGDPSRIKEKILTQIPDKIKGDDGMPEALVNAAEYVRKKLSTDKRVPGRLRSSPDFLNFMEEVIKAPEEVLQVYREGYRPPWISEPPTVKKIKNNKSAR